MSAARPADGPSRHRDEPLRAIFWMVISSIFFVSTAMIVRGVSDRLPPAEMVFFRVSLGLVAMVPLMLRVGFSGFRTRHLKQHFVRASFNFFALSCSFTALSMMPVANVAALQFTLPLMSILFALFFLKEPVGFGGWAACVVGFLGALVILRPGMSAVGLGSILALASAAFYAASYVTLRTVTAHDSPTTVMLMVNLLMLPWAVVPAAIYWVTPSWPDFGWMCLMALVNLIAQYALTRAFSYAGARVIMPFDFLRLPMAAGIGFVVFAELPDMWTWIGAAIIFASSYYVLQSEADRRAGKAATSAADSKEGG